MKKIVITGGQGDIAQAIKQTLELEGAFKVFSPSRQEMDVTDIQSVHSYISAVTPDILINNAGYVVPQAICIADIDEEQRSININLFGVFNCANAALKANKAAQIINIGSSAATKVHGTWSSYCATKAAVVMATKCWAEEGVNTICLSPGRAATKMRTSLFQDEDPSTLLNPFDFARVVSKAIQGYYPSGSHIDVTVSNIKEIINET